MAGWFVPHNGGLRMILPGKIHDHKGVHIFEDVHKDLTQLNNRLIQVENGNYGKKGKYTKLKTEGGEEDAVSDHKKYSFDWKGALLIFNTAVIAAIVGLLFLGHTAKAAGNSPFIINMSCASGAYNIITQSCLESGGGSVTSVTASAPLQSSGGSTPDISFMANAELGDIRDISSHSGLWGIDQTGSAFFSTLQGGDLSASTAVISGTLGVDTINDSLGSEAISILNRQIFSSSNVVVADFNNQAFYDQTGELSIAFDSRTVNDAGGQVSIDYQNRILEDNGGDASNDYQNRTLVFQDGGIAVDYQGGVLGDENDIQSLNWTGRQMRNATGQVIFDYSQSAGGIYLPNGIAQFNGIATVASGMPALYAQSNLTAQAAAITATTLITPTTAAMYRVCFVSTITRAATASSILGGTNGFQIQYTDADDSVVKKSIARSILTSTANTTGTSLGDCFMANVKASTALQYLFDYSSTGTTTMQYNLHIRAEAI